MNGLLKERVKISEKAPVTEINDLYMPKIQTKQGQQTIIPHVTIKNK